MNKRLVLGIALASFGALTAVSGESPLLKPHPAEPIAKAETKQAADSAVAPATAVAPKAGKTAPGAKTPIASKKALKAQGKIVAISPRGKAGNFCRVILEMKGGKKMSIDVANAMVASHGLKAGKTVRISYKLERGKKLATRIAS
jgi:hypothetical protein